GRGGAGEAGRGAAGGARVVREWTEPDHGRDSEIPGRAAEEVTPRTNDCRPGTSAGVLPAPGRLGRWLLVLIASAAVAHVCPSGDHGDADLLPHLVTAVGSSPASASP